MTVFRKLSLLVSTLLVFTVNTFSQPSEDYKFKHFTTENGLSDNICHEAIMDSRGFLWFATQGGLTKFDGTTFTIIENNDSDPNSLYGEVIMDIIETKDSILWIASNGGGLNRYDPRKDKFEHFYLDSLKSFYPAKCLMNDSENNLWVGGYNIGLNLFNKDSSQFTSYPLATELENNTEKFVKNSVQDIIEDIDNKHILWLATNDGLFKFDKRTKKYKRFALNGLSNGMTCLSLFMDEPHQLWIGTWASGLIKFNTEDESIIKFIPDKYALEVEGNFMTNVIHDIEKINDDEFWLSTRDQGILVFNLQNNSFSSIEPSLEDPYSIKSNEILGVYKDPKQAIWVFNIPVGISQLIPKSNVYKKLVLDTVCNQENKNSVTDFALDSISNMLYVTSINCESLYKLKIEESGKFLKMKQPTFSIDIAEGLSKVYLTSKNELFVIRNFHEAYLEGSSLLMLDPLTNSIREYDHSILSTIIENGNSANIRNIIEDDSGSLWLGSARQGLIKINPNRVDAKQYINNAIRPDWLDSTVEISDILYIPMERFGSRHLKMGCMNLIQKLKYLKITYLP